MSGPARGGAPTLVRVADASLGTAIVPGRRLAQTVAGFLGAPPESVRLVEVAGASRPLALPPDGPSDETLDGTMNGATDAVCSFAVDGAQDADAAVDEGQHTGLGFVAMSASAAFRLLDRCLGGPPGRPQPVRALTAVELHVWRAAVGTLLRRIEDLAHGRLQCGEPVAGNAGLAGQQGVVWHLVWEGGAVPSPSRPPHVEDAVIRVGLDLESAATWMAEVCPPSPVAAASLLERVCGMPATVPFVVGRVETTVGAMATWEPGRVVLLDTDGDAPWQAELGAVRFTAAPASVDGMPHLVVMERHPGRNAAIMSTGPRPGTGGGPHVRR